MFLAVVARAIFVFVRFEHNREIERLRVQVDEQLAQKFFFVYLPRTTLASVCIQRFLVRSEQAVDESSLK